MSTYNQRDYGRLKYKFNESENIDTNYSQSWQDMFVLSMTNGKRNGTFVEIGAWHPVSISNSYLLESKYNWNGISIEINPEHSQEFENIRKCNFILADATSLDYNKLFEDNKLPFIIDYLQLDIDPYDITYECLLLIPFDKYKFSVITYETDFYRENDNGNSFRDKARKIFGSYGYKLVVGNVSNPPFEDWWVHPDLISNEIIDLFSIDGDLNDNAEKIFFS